MKAIKRISAFLLAVLLVTAFAIPAFADDQSFSFDFAANNGGTYHVYTTKSNQKIYAQDPGTVKTDSSTTFPPTIRKWTFALFYSSTYNPNSEADNKNYTRATYNTWMSGAYEAHMSYLSGQNITGRHYYIGGRMDDTLTDPNYYHASGWFNADDTKHY